MTNWDYNRKGCTNNLEAKFKQYCGPDNVERFGSFSSESSQISLSPGLWFELEVIISLGVCGLETALQ